MSNRISQRPDVSPTTFVRGACGLQLLSVVRPSSSSSSVRRRRPSTSSSVYRQFFVRLSVRLSSSVRRRPSAVAAIPPRDSKQ